MTYGSISSFRDGKRLLDLVVAGIGMVVLAPAMAAIAAVVAVGLGRPIIFRQPRPGLHGKVFTLYKFRTMTDGRDPQGGLLSDDHRLTWLGSHLRSMSLDELPELWNVLRGDMTLVGPRPLLVEYLPRYSDDEARRHLVRPGLTGWAQIHGRNDTTWRDRLAMDVWYVDHLSVGLDLRILARTVTAVITRAGASPPDEATMAAFHGSAAPPHRRPSV